MHWQTRPPTERARSCASITVLPRAVPLAERYQAQALGELLYRSHQHVLGGQRWATSAQRPGLEDACRRAGTAIAEALDLLGGRRHD